MPKVPLDEQLKPVVDATTRLGYQICLDQDHNKNVVLSPLGIISMLAVLYAGARGRTRQQLARTIAGNNDDAILEHMAALLNELKGRSQLTEYEASVVNQRQAEREKLLAQGMDPKEVEREVTWRIGSINMDSRTDLNFVLLVANSMWIQQSYPCKPSFLERARTTLNAHVEMLDFQEKREAAAAINAWARENTNGFIDAVITPDMLSPLVRGVLTNTIYFKALWQGEFGPPRPGLFSLFDGTKTQAQMIMKKGRLGYAEDEDYLAVGVPYQRRPSSMLLVLPRATGKRALVDLERKLEQRGHDQLFAKVDMRQVRLTMPEFELEFRGDLIPVLSKLGLQDVLDRGDYSGISEEEGFGINTMLHQARIRVDQYGTEATAATSSLMMGMSEPPKEFVELTLDRPFLFLIIDQPTGTVLFVGRTVNPG